MNKKSLSIFLVGFALLLIVVVVVAKQQANERERIPSDRDTASTSQSNNSAKATTTNSNAELVKEDLAVGEGAEATAGNTVTVNYVGKFENGEVFDSTEKAGRPFSFTLGKGEVIKGWDQGVEGMKVGGKRKLVVPPELGYGPNDYMSIPGGSTLVFEVELLEVK